MTDPFGCGPNPCGWSCEKKCFIGEDNFNGTSEVATTLWKYPAVADGEGAFANSWQNPNNALSLDGLYSQATPLRLESETRYLTLQDYDFVSENLGDVSGVEVEIFKGSLALDIVDWRIYLVNAQGIYGSARVLPGVWPVVNTPVVHGSSTDMWGTTLHDYVVWTPEFGIAIMAYTRGTIVDTALIDTARIRITHIVAQQPPIKWNILSGDWYMERAYGDGKLIGATPDSEIEFKARASANELYVEVIPAFTYPQKGGIVLGGNMYLELELVDPASNDPDILRLFIDDVLQEAVLIFETVATLRMGYSASAGVVWGTYTGNTSTPKCISVSVTEPLLKRTAGLRSSVGNTGQVKFDDFNFQHHASPGLTDCPDECYDAFGCVIHSYWYNTPAGLVDPNWVVEYGSWAPNEIDGIEVVGPFFTLLATPAETLYNQASFSWIPIDWALANDFVFYLKYENAADHLKVEISRAAGSWCVSYRLVSVVGGVEVVSKSNLLKLTEEAPIALTLAYDNDMTAVCSFLQNGNGHSEIDIAVEPVGNQIALEVFDNNLKLWQKGFSNYASLQWLEVRDVNIPSINSCDLVTHPCVVYTDYFEKDPACSFSVNSGSYAFVPASGGNASYLLSKDCSIGVRHAQPFVDPESYWKNSITFNWTGPNQKVTIFAASDLALTGAYGSIAYNDYGGPNAKLILEVGIGGVASQVLEIPSDDYYYRQYPVLELCCSAGSLAMRGWSGPGSFPYSSPWVQANTAVPAGEYGGFAISSAYDVMVREVQFSLSESVKRRDCPRCVGALIVDCEWCGGSTPDTIPLQIRGLTPGGDGACDQGCVDLSDVPFLCSRADDCKWEYHGTVVCASEFDGAFDIYVDLDEANWLVSLTIANSTIYWRGPRVDCNTPVELTFNQELGDTCYGALSTCQLF